LLSAPQMRGTQGLVRRLGKELECRALSEALTGPALKVEPKSHSFLMLPKMTDEALTSAKFRLALGVEGLDTFSKVVRLT
jgi:hypothetical protein